MNDCESGCDNTIEVIRGATLALTLRPMTTPLVYKAIAAVPTLTPLTLTVTAHGLPVLWAVAVADAGGLDSINAAAWPPGVADLHDAIAIDANTLQFNEIDAARGGQQYTSGGKIAFYTPFDLSTGTASIDVYDYPRVSAALPVLTVAATLDDTAKSVAVVLSPANTAGLVNPRYCYAVKLTQDTEVTVIEQGIFEMADAGACP